MVINRHWKPSQQWRLRTSYVQGETQATKSEIKVWFTVWDTCHFVLEESLEKKWSWMHQGTQLRQSALLDIFCPTPGLKSGICNNSKLSAEGTLISASAVPTTGKKERKGKKRKKKKKSFF